MSQPLAGLLLFLCVSSAATTGCCSLGSAHMDFTKWGTGEVGFTPRNDGIYSDGVPSDLRKKAPWYDPGM